ncbi:hypothetical protein RHS01_10936 [Rhizoctonia solani]|uniref:Uncharacterized protein n=1 Tax=Rhizoctonia solani TaxID=456999 RepID=A0A8H7I1A2_9AGAM|nr:hypothetical protein RHS01_10936 [Rhizoctonia solani]
MSGGARFSFMDDNEEAPESPSQDPFLLLFLFRVLRHPPSQDLFLLLFRALHHPSPRATPSRGAPRSETPSISDVLVDENGSDASVADPNSGNATQDIPTDVVPILPPEGSADNPQPASAVSTPGIEEVSVVTHNSETPIREPGSFKIISHPSSGPRRNAPEERAAITANEFLSSGDLEAAHQAITDLKELLSQGSNLPLSTKAQAAETLALYYLKGSSIMGTSTTWRKRIKSHGGLGRTLAAQFEHTADPDYAELAINHLNQALELTPPGHSDRPKVLADFARIELAQYARSDDRNSLEQALARCEEALDSVPTNAPERTPLSGLLGGALLSRFDRTHKSPERPKRMRSYGDAIMMRAMVQNDMNSLNTAINIQEMALDYLLPNMLPIRYNRQSSQGLPYSLQSHRSRHARITDLLGKSFMAKYRTAVQPPRTQYLNYAVELHRQAVALTPSDHRRYAGRLESLGKAYSKRYRSQLRRQNAQQSDLDAAERCLREVIERDPSRIEDMLRELGNLGLH